MAESKLLSSIILSPKSPTVTKSEDANSCRSSTAWELHPDTPKTRRSELSFLATYVQNFHSRKIESKKFKIVFLRGGLTTLRSDLHRTVLSLAWQQIYFTFKQSALNISQKQTNMGSFVIHGDFVPSKVQN